MRILHLTATAGADGRVRLDFPAEPHAEDEVAVVVQSKPTSNGSGRELTPEERGWPPGYFESVVGSIDDPTFMRHPQGDFPKRVDFDGE